MKFRNLRIATKLWVAVGIAVTAMAVLIAFATVRSARLQAESDAALAQIDATVRAATRWAALTETNVARVQATVISNDSAVDAAFKGSIVATLAETEKVQKRVQEMALGEHGSVLLAKILAQQKTVNDSLSKSRQLKNTGNNDDARAEIESVFDPAVKSYLASLGEFAAAQEMRADETRQRFADERRLTIRIAQGVIVVIVIALVLGASLLIRSIRAPLLEAVGVAARIAQGDLSVRRESRRGDEFGELMREMQRTVEKLNAMLHEIKSTSDMVGAAAQEIAQGHADLSTRTEEQASSLEQTAASMEQMTATVAQNAENAKKANQLATGASEVAARGGQAVGAVVGTMSGISESSKKIADIIGVIDGIAFQTNILALNAAVEAARAGEQGRGFAVVASEVRSLAQRSAGAAKEIRQLISDSVGRIEEGSRQVEDAGETMAEIVTAVKRVTDLIAEISAASQEQSQSLSQVSDTVQQLEKVTQQNAAMVEEATAASGSLEEQAAALKRAVAGFKLASAGGSAPAAAATSRPAPAKSQVPHVAPQGSAAAALPRHAAKAAPELKAPAAPKTSAKRATEGKDKANEGWEEF